MEKIASFEGEAELFFNASRNYVCTWTPEAFSVEDKGKEERVLELKLGKSFDKGEPLPSENKNLEDPGYLRFSDFNNKNYSLSVSGLKLKTKSTTRFIASTNRSFSSSSHFWEFHVPKTCNDIMFGVLASPLTPAESSADSEKGPEEFFVSFKTSTDRVVGLKLDLYSNELRFWLNGNFQSKKALQLPEDRKFTPALKISGKMGKLILLNPFAVDPEEGEFSLLFNSLKPSAINVWEGIMNYGIANLLERIILLKSTDAEVDVKLEERGNFKIIESHFSILELKSKEEREEFISENLKEKESLIVSNDDICTTISTEILGQAPQKEEKIKFLKEFLSKNCITISNFFFSQYSQLSFTSLSEEVSQIQKIKNFQKKDVVFHCPDKLKLLNDQGDFLVVAKERIAKLNPFENLAGFLKFLSPDEKSFFIKEELVTYFIQNFPWGDSLKYTSEASLSPILKTLRNGFKIASNIIQFPYTDISEILTPLAAMKYCLRTGFRGSQRNILLLKTILEIESQVSPFQEMGHVYSAFERFCTLNSWQDHCLNPEFLAEASLYMKDEITNCFSLAFSDPSIIVDPIVELNKAMFLRKLEASIPADFDLGILNKELKSISSEYYQYFSLKDNDEISTIHNSRNFVVLRNDRKEIEVWNCSLIPYKIGIFNINIFETESADYGNQESEMIGEYSDFNILFDGDRKPSPEPLLKREFSTPKPKIEPDLVYAEMIYNMGFDIVSAKEALIQVNNKGVDEAIEWLLNNPSIEKEAKTVKESKVIKESWVCPLCTFQNKSFKTVCEMCHSQAPIEAYTDVVENQISPTKNENSEFSKKNEAKTILDNCTVEMVKIVPLNSKICPFLLVSIVKSENSYFLRIKQIVFNQNFIYKHLHTFVNGFASNITSEWITSLKWGEIVERIIGTESEIALDSLFYFTVGTENLLKASKTLDYPIGEEKILDFALETHDFNFTFHYTTESSKASSLIMHGLKFTMDLIDYKPISFSNKLDSEIIPNTHFKEFRKMGILASVRYYFFDEFIISCDNKSKITKLPFEDSEKFKNAIDMEEFIILITSSGNFQNANLIAIEESQNETQTDSQLKEILENLNFFSSPSIPSQNCISSQFIMEGNNYCKHYFAKNEGKFKFSLSNRNSENNIVILNISNPHSGSDNWKISNSQEISPKNAQEIPLEIVQIEGACLSSTFVPSTILMDNKEVFMSNYPKPSFIFAHLHKQRMKVSSYIVSSNLMTLNGGVLLGEGLIFISDSLSHFTRAKEEFSNMKHKDYLAWCIEQKVGNRLPWQPISSFILEEKEEVKEVMLDEVVEGNYIMLLPTNGKASSKVSTYNFEKSPTEITKFAVKGISTCSIDIQPYKLQKCTQISDISEITVNGKAPLASFMMKFVFKSSYSAIFLCDKADEVTVEADIPNYEFVSASLSSISDQTVEYLISNSKTEELTASIWQKEEEIEGNLMLLDKLSDIVPEIISKVTSKEWISIFLQRVLSSKNATRILKSSQNLIYRVNSNEISTLISENLEKIRFEGITLEGLDSFFSVINNLNSSSKRNLIPKLISELEKNIIRMRELRNPDYLRLRAFYNVEGMVFENCLFSLENLSQSDISSKDEKEIDVPYIVSEIKESSFKKFAIELQQEATVKALKLYFYAKGTVERILVKVTAIKENERILLRNGFINDATVHYVSENAAKISTETLSKCPKVQKEMNSIVISLPEFDCQKLEVQLNYVLPDLMESKGVQLPVFPKIIVSNLKGNKSELTVPARMMYIKDIYVGNFKVARYESSEGSNSVFFMVNNSSVSKSPDNFSQLNEEFSNLQSEIIELIQDNAQPSLLNKKISSISDIQNNLYESDFVKKSAFCYDFEFSLCLRLCRCLSNIENQHYELNTETVYDISLKLFEFVILRERGSLYETALNLLSANLIQKLDKATYQRLIIEICQKFLSSSNQEKEISFKRVIESLLRISVPASELLFWLSNIIKEPVTKERDSVIQVTSLLLLINKSFAATSEEFDLSKVSKNEGSNCLHTHELLPAGVRRSVSHPIKNDFGLLGKFEYPLPSLNEEQKLSAITKITIWICQSPFPESDKVSMLLLALGTLKKIIDSSFITSIHEIVANSSDFFSLVLNCLKLGSEDLMEKLKEILEKILEPKILVKLDDPNNTLEQNSKLNALKEKAKYEDLKLILISHLKILAEGVILFALKPEVTTAYSQIIGETSTISWVEHITFLLDFLMVTSEKFSVKTVKKDQKKPQKVTRKSTSGIQTIEEVKIPPIAEEVKVEVMKEEEEEKISVPTNILPPPGVTRSFSHGNQKSLSETTQKDKEGYLPLSLALSLVELLAGKSEKAGFSFENFPKVWFLVLRVVQKVKLSIVIETKLFDNLVEAYLAAPEETQQTVLPELLKLTKNMVLQPVNQKEICSLVLKALFTVIEKVRLHNSLSFSLLRGLLDILLTKSTPKPEEFYTKPLEKAFCKLNKEGAQVVLDHVANFLQNYINLGGRDGARMASQAIVQDLILADDLLKLLTKSESSPDTLAITEITADLARASPAIRKLIQWYILNKMPENGDSPSTELLHSISNAVMKIFTIFAEYEDLVKLCLHELISICQEFDQLVFSELTISQISNQIANVIIQRSCKVLDELLNLWVTSDSIASYVAFEVKGFDFLLDRLGLPSSEDKRFSYIQNTDLELEDRASPSQAEEKKEAGQLEEIQPEEFANKILLIQKPGQNFAGIQTDWSINKKGSKGRVLLFSMFQEYYSEYPLVISLERTCELREIKMGFNLVSTDYANKILGAPSAVLVEGGLDLKNMAPLGILEPISDEGYSNFSVRVYLKNFATTRGSSFNEGVKSLSSKRVKYLRFKIWRPIVTFIEGSSVLYGRIYKNINVSVSFLSVIGYDVNKLPTQLKSHMIDSQKTSSLQVIGKLCNPNFNETLNILSHKPDVVMKLRNSFDHFSHLLMNHENWLSPVFLALSTNNPELGDYLLDKLFDLNKSLPHSKLALEIMAACPEKSTERILKLHSFVIRSLFEISKHEIHMRMNSLMAFIEAFCSSLSLATFGIKEKISLNVKNEDLQEILKLFEEHNSNSATAKTLTKLFITLTNPPLPFSIADESLPLKFLQIIHAKSLENPIFCEMLAPLFCGNKKCSEKVLENNGEILESLTKKIENLLENPGEEGYNLKSLKLYFTALNSSVMCDNSIKKWVGDKSWHISLYNSMKVKEGHKIFKDLGSDVVASLVDLVRNVIVGSSKAEQSFADILIHDLTNLESKRDNLYVTQFLTPLLNAELFVPVCINAYDSQHKRWVTEGCKVSESGKSSSRKNNLQQTLEAMNSKLLSTFQREQLFNMFKKKFTSKNPQHKSMIKSQFVLAESQNEDAAPYLLENVHKALKQGPFLIVLAGSNAGQECVCGFFSAKPLNDKMQENSKHDYVADEIYSVPFSEDSFFFYYEQETVSVHIMAEKNSNQLDQEYIASLSYFEEGGGGLSIYHKGVERIFLSYSAGNMAYVDINLLDMKPEESETIPIPNDIPADFNFRTCEYWVLKTKENEKNTASGSNWSSNVLIPNWYNANNPLNYFRPLPVYMVPATMTVDKMSKHFFAYLPELILKLSNEKMQGDTQIYGLWEFSKRYSASNNILDIEFDIHSVSEERNEEGEDVRKRNLSGSVSYLPKMSVFDAFQKKGGVDKIIYVILKSLTLWKNKKKAQRWFLWIKELCFFSSLPHFFNFFIKSKESVELLFEILAGKPDDEDKSAIAITDKSSSPAPVRKWEEEENKAIKYTYQVLSDVFKFDNDEKVRDFAIEKKLLHKLLERIAGISKEEPRRLVEEDEEKKEEKTPEKPKEKVLEQPPEIGNSKSSKKKGIGYASDNTGQNQKWNVSEYYESQKSKADQLQGLISILDSFLDLENWNPSERLKEILCSSALLPLLESAFRSGSLLDMSKDCELFTCYLSLVRTISKHKELVPCLLDIDSRYKPKQTESIFKLIGKLQGLAEIFLNCVIKDENNKNEFSLLLCRQSTVTQELAENISKSYIVLEEAVEHYQELLDDDEDDEEHVQEAKIKETLALSTAKAYPVLLSDLRFDHMSMKDASGKFVHHYAFNIPNSSPPQTKIMRLAQELADLSTALPCEHTNSIFVRCDENRLDVMKALIMGSAGTPYGHGAYEFDIFFDDSYPNSPPKVNLTTTGNGRVRFNPNLYSCGKVCLSLLGTWRGNATENWDPKLSTLLQVLLSLQSIIMSEEVYFNEPGFEGEAGSEEGEKKNQAYSNIVKYCNIKFAMIDQIKNPSKGFEVPIRRHFYLKADEILEEVGKWLEQAETHEASYSGLVCDHNNSWCQEFRKSGTRYVEMLKEAIEELRTELTNLEPPSVKDTKKKASKAKRSKKLKSKKEEAVISLDEVDVTYDEFSESKQLNVSDESVMDRWSRYIGAMGVDAVAKQAKSSIFIAGLGPLGVEIAKNIVLSGVKKITLFDKEKVQMRDLSGQFFLAESDIGKNRVDACISKIQQLNLYVKVDKCQKSELNEKMEEIFEGYDLVVLCGQPLSVQIAVSTFCHSKGIKFIAADSYGPYGKVFVGFGEKFSVLDKNGEEAQEVMLKNITCNEKGVVELIDGTTHDFWDGDTVLIHSVKGMRGIGENNSIDKTLHKIRVLNAKSFEIGDTTKYTQYEGSGLAKQVKTPTELDFKDLGENLKNPKFDENLQFYDFEKIENQKKLHIAFALLEEFRVKNNRIPSPWDFADMNSFVSSLKDFSEKDSKLVIANELIKEQLQSESTLPFLQKFSLTCQGCIPAFEAFLGGLITQEIVKGLTQKYTPVNQIFYPDVSDLIASIESFTEETISKMKNSHLVDDRYQALRIVVGEDLLGNLRDSKIFMIGAGAIGCELLKNFSMIGLGTRNGHITVTDPDIIEVSNLNRQFLFREKHLRKPKSSTACAAAIMMNPQLKGHITAKLDKIHDGTAHIYNEDFFSNLTAVTNALDNVAARLYIDRRCVSAHTPLLESGTLGPKGHVQVIVPKLTESYSSQKDPEEDKEIPHCTLKMFPEETLHCVEWARDLFGKYYTQRPKSLQKVLEDPSVDTQEVKILQEALKFSEKAPNSFIECIELGRQMFQKHFVNDIKQLLYTYPLDAKTKDGKDFWSLPKRPPTPVEFSPKNETHSTCVASIACLFAHTFGIEIPKDPRKAVTVAQIASEAMKFKVKQFQPSSEKAKNMISQIEEDEDKEQNQEQSKEKPNEKPVDGASLVKSIKEISKAKGIKKVVPSEFEKDNDANFHIDFIYAMANVRSENYNLEKMDWITVKLKAGKIVPALATTTACVAGLQTIELMKVVKGMKLSEYKNAFLNLAVNMMQLSEPGPVSVKTIREDLKVTIWDRWECSFKSQNEKLKSVVSFIQKEYKLVAKDIFFGSKPILMSAVHKDKLREEILEKPLADLLSLDEDEKFADLIITFTHPDSETIIEGTPTVRVLFV